MKILLCGATGLLGSSLGPYLRSAGHQVVTQGRAEGAQKLVDLNDRTATDRLFREVIPDTVINLVALTNVDFCEAHPNEAYRVNVRTVENLVDAVKRQSAGCHLIHISTDQVYDGPGPHGEEEITLMNTYSFSKYTSELVARQAAASTVIRANFFGRSHCPKRASFSDWLFDALKRKSPIKVFEDILFSPLSMIGLCEMIELLVRKKPEGTFNLGSREGMSKAEFAFAFATTLGLPTDTMARSTSKDAGVLTARRPNDMRMDSHKFETAVGLSLPALIDEVRRVSEEYREQL